MCPFVYLQVFRSGKYFPAAGEWTRKGFLPCVHSNVIHQLIFGFERSSVSRAALPKTRVCRALRSTDVFHCEVRDDFVHTREQFVAQLFWRRLIGVQPLTAHVTARRRAYIAQEGMWRMRVRVRHQRRRAALVVHVAAPLPALIQRLLREQFTAATVVTQVASGLVRVQWIWLVVRSMVRRRVWRRCSAVLRTHAAPRLRRHLQPVRGQMCLIRLEKYIHRGGGRRRRIAPFARHHPRGGSAPLLLLLTASSPTLP